MKKIHKSIIIATIIAITGVTTYNSRYKLSSCSNITLKNINALASDETGGSDYKKKIKKTTECEDWTPIGDNYYIHDTYTQVDIDCEGTGRISCISETYEENWDSEIVYK